MYKIEAKPSSYEPGKIRWFIFEREWNFIFPDWSIVACYDTKDEAIDCVNNLIEAGTPLYINKKYYKKEKE